MGQYVGGTETHTERTVRAMCTTVPQYLTQEAGHALLLHVRSHLYTGVLRLHDTMMRVAQLPAGAAGT